MRTKSELPKPYKRILRFRIHAFRVSCLVRWYRANLQQAKESVRQDQELNPHERTWYEITDLSTDKVVWETEGQ